MKRLLLTMFTVLFAVGAMLAPAAWAQTQTTPQGKRYHTKPRGKAGVQKKHPQKRKVEAWQKKPHYAETKPLKKEARKQERIEQRTEKRPAETQ